MLLARAVYAFNWYNVGAVLPLLGSALGATTPQLGVVLGAFLAGAALFQVPAGFAALRWGNRTVSILALGIMGVFCLASAFSPNWIVLAGLRFGAGAGAAFFFAPALGLVTSYYPAGSRGPVIGLYNAGFNLGSGIGLFGGAFVGAIFGWSWALAIGGIVLLIATALSPLILPVTETTLPRRTLGEVWRASRPVLRSRNLWALSLSCMGLWTAFYVAAQYFVQYAHSDHPGWTLAVAAGLPTLMIAVEVFGGPLGGWLGERQKDMRVLLGVFGVATGAALLLIPFVGLAALVGVFALLGFLDGGVFAIMYLLPTYLPEMQREGLSLGLGLLNGIQIFVGSGLAILFAFVAAYAGYTDAWVLAGLFGMAPLPLLLLVRGHLAPRFSTSASAASPVPVDRTDRPT